MIVSQTPIVLDQVLLTSSVNIKIFHVGITLKHLISPIFFPLQRVVLHGFSKSCFGWIVNPCPPRIHRVLFVIRTILILCIRVILILYNHVVKYNACHHDALKNLLIKKREAPK